MCLGGYTYYSPLFFFFYQPQALPKAAHQVETLNFPKDECIRFPINWYIFKNKALFFPRGNEGCRYIYNSLNCSFFFVKRFLLLFSGKRRTAAMLQASKRPEPLCRFVFQSIIAIRTSPILIVSCVQVKTIAGRRTFLYTHLQRLTCDLSNKRYIIYYIIHYTCVASTSLFFFFFFVYTQSLPS